MATKRGPAKKTVAPAKSKGGRPSPYLVGYKVDFPSAAKKLALLGAIDKDIADFFGVAESTLYLWKLKHPEFAKALQAGKAMADAEVVDRLYQRALGFEHDEVDIRVIDREVVQTKVRKIYAPDTVACIFWLKNRQSAKWRDKVEVGNTDTQGKDVAPADPMEGARRIAFALAKANETLKD
jgi:hypothetical protein